MAVTRGQGQLRQFGWTAPRHRDVLPANRVARDLHGDERYQEGRAGIARGELLGTDVDDINAELLPQLARDCLAVGLRGFAFSPRELPQTAVALLGWALAYEETVAAGNDGGNDTGVRVGHCTPGRAHRPGIDCKLLTTP